jgi:hypothetical protein
MRRLFLAFVVALLTVSASGVHSLIVDEPCSGSELAGQGEEDGVCPPTCVTCGCCTQAAETIALALASAPDSPTTDLVEMLPNPMNADPRDILHVPKSVLA